MIKHPENINLKKDRAFTELGLLLTGLLYPLWGLVAAHYYNYRNDGILVRVPFLMACVGVLFLSRYYTWSLKNTRICFNIILWALTIHYFYIISTNSLTLLTTVGTIVHIIGVCSALAVRKELGSFMILMILGTFIVFRKIEGLDWPIMWIFIIIICIYFYIGAYFRSLLLSLATNEAEKSIAMGKTAVQAAHDIRSPLSALNLMYTSEKMNLIPEEEKKIVKIAIQRIQNISEDLLERNRTIRDSSLQYKDFNLVTAVSEIIEEKIAVFERTKISFETELETYSLKGNKIDFQRALSNILNNSHESIAENCRVHIQIRHKNRSGFAIEITDNGPGIEKNISESLFKNTIKSSKIGGSGIGLKGARELLEKLNLSIRLDLGNKNGTKIVIETLS